MEGLRRRIQASGPLSFADFMATCLYDQEHGYYSDPDRPRVGQQGDFVTNVAIGETFGRLLAHRLHQFWTANRAPAPLQILELGPEGGALALDILGEARRIDPSFHAALRYHACEHAARKRPALRQEIARAGEPHLTVIEEPSRCRGEVGVVLANEVLDALPVHLIRFHQGAWRERRVSASGSGLTWSDVTIQDETLAREAQHLGTKFPDGYLTELCLALPGFFEDLARCFDHGLFTFFDYGHLQPDYYHPARTTGTLRTYNRHLAGEDPLILPGEQDLTAHVDFSRAAAAAGSAGLEALAFGRQEPYLVALAAPLLTSGTPSPSFVRQLRSLTHPAFLGSSFHVLEFRKGSVSPGLDLPGSLTSLGQLL